MTGNDQHRKLCTLLAVALVMGAVATAEGAAGIPGSAATHDAVRQIRMVDRETLTRWISELAQPQPEKPTQDQTPKFSTPTHPLLAAMQSVGHQLPSDHADSVHRILFMVGAEQGLVNLPPPSRA